MSRYYAGKKLFNWIRSKLGVVKPDALGWGEWEKWETRLKTERPIAYFLTETVPDILEKPGEWFVDPVNNVKYYLVNRFVDKTHYMRTGLKPGEWHEFEERLLHGMFEEFIDFVEVESAWHHLVWADKDTRAKYNLPWYYNYYLLRWRTWRCADAGVDHYKWAAGLVWKEEECQPGSEMIGQRTHQALAAEEILSLYDWWKNIRPTRGDPWVVSGFRAHWDAMDTKYGDGDWLLCNEKPTTPEEEAEYHRLSEANDALEKSWADEDEQKMIQLIKLRKNLWT